MKLTQLASRRNLRLAWRRITSGANVQYKRFYRPLHNAYEVALDQNLDDLRSRLLAQSWEPQVPERFYLPKASGLQRPVTLLHIEDQIVLQALANVVARRVHGRRQKFELKTVFSNIPESPASPFFVQSWHRTYTAFSRRVEQHYLAGRTWIADFDLAAFYETVSHDLLLRTAFPRGVGSGDTVWMKRCLSCWASAGNTTGLGHGLPQGPIASDFLAEVFLLPIDEAMGIGGGVVRYVDDVRVFARAENSLRQRVISLEIHCRERGLIPQVGKYHLKQARSLSEARGMLPSVGAAHDTSHPRLAPSEAQRLLRTAVEGRPFRVKDKSRVRYVFYRAMPSPSLLRVAAGLLKRSPEHVDALMAFFSQYDYRKSVRDCCLEALANSPYEYVRGEAWHVLARHYGTERAFDGRVRRRLVREATTAIRDRGASIGLKWGVAHFLCAVEKRDGGSPTQYLRTQSALGQALTGPALPASALNRRSLVRSFLVQEAIEPGLALASQLQRLGRFLKVYGIAADELGRQLGHVYGRLALMEGSEGKLDVVGEILRRRYGVRAPKFWSVLLGGEYLHAVGLLVQAEAAFVSNPSAWLSHQNSFNQTRGCPDSC